MKKIKLISVLLALVLCVCLFVACDSNDDGNGNGEKPSVTQYTLTFDLDGGSLTNTSVVVDEGTVVDLTQYVPAKEDCSFTGWTLDGESVTSVTVNGDITVKATWEVLVSFEANDDQSAYVLTYIKGQENLVLPATHDSKPVIGIKANAIANADAVKALVIGNSYTAIEEGTLSALKNLESLSVPFVKSNDEFAKLFEKVETVPQNCYGVTVGADTYAIPSALVSLAITGGDGVLNFESNRFRFENLVVASDELVTLKARSISENEYLKNVDISGCKNITAIGDSNFQNCKNLRNVNIGGLSKLETLGTHCFYFYNPGTNDTWEIDSIDMSGLSSLKVTGQMCFWYVDIDTLDFTQTAIKAFGRQNVMYSKVKNVKLPATLNLNLTDEEISALESEYGMTYLNNSEFLANCTGLENIEVDPISIFLSSENGALYDYDKTTLIKYANKDAKSYVAPSTLKVVKPTAFANATALETVDLTACELTSIGYNAFSGCSASMSVGFDKYGYYATTGNQVTLGNGWKGGCNVTYGTRYLFFTVNVKGITDKMTVATDTVDFTVTATYGDDTANVVVKVNGVELEKGTNGYTATLNDGANTIEITASFDGNTSDTKTYTVTKDSKWTLKTSLKDGQKVVWANGNLTFTVWAENVVGEKQNIENLIKVYLDCSYSSTYQPMVSNCISIDYTDNVATVTLDSDVIMNWFDYKIDKAHHMKVEVKQSDSITLEKIFDAQYFEKAPQIVSETPTTGNSVVNEDWNIDLQCKLGNDVQKIVSVKVEMDTGYGYTMNNTTNTGLKANISSDGLSAKVTVEIASFGSVYFMEGYLNVRVTVTLENGLTAVIVFNATYEG